MESILEDKEPGYQTVEAIEKYINKIDGIVSSKIITDNQSKILEVHVLSDYSRSPKQIVRDIQSCCAAVFNIQLEYKTISIVQIDSNMSGRKRRLKFNDFNVISDGHKLTVKTYLSNDGKIFEGSASGLNSPRGRYIAAAEACINAIHSFMGCEFVFHVADVQKMPIAGVDSFCVAIGYIQNDNQGTLLGSSLQKGDEYCSIMKATLDAVNRFIEKS